MDGAYVSALAALTGSVIGGFTSFATSWLVQQNQARTTRRLQEIAKRESLYGQFIDEASKRFAEAVEKDKGAVSDLVLLYSEISRMQLFAPAKVVTEARQVMDLVLATYMEPPKDLWHLKDLRDTDVLRRFGEVCREDLENF